LAGRTGRRRVRLRRPVPRLGRRHQTGAAGGRHRRRLATPGRRTSPRSGGGSFASEPRPPGAAEVVRNAFSGASRATCWYQEAHNPDAHRGQPLGPEQGESLLREGRAMGGKDLKDYMEGKGYAEAARWVYSQGLEPGSWSDGSILTLTEVRNIHKMALDPVWEVAPHPNATERETPGSFREHDI